MDELKVTKDIAIRAILFGSCRIPKIGSSADEYSQEDLVWSERLFTKEELKTFIAPLWTNSGSGSGSGYGSGYGDGSGYGSGSGDGYGYGDGYVDGSGDGYVDGSGYGDGYGYGSGYGYVDGSGSGDGYGSGYGDGYGSGYGDGSGEDLGEKILKVINREQAVVLKVLFLGLPLYLGGWLWSMY